MDVTPGELRATAAGFIGALVILFVLLYFIGIDQVLAVLGLARTPVLAVELVVALAWLSSWGLSLRTVLGVLGIRVSALKSFLVFASATFANNVTPFGQAGGEPFSALLISRSTESEYETSLAAIASVDALNFVPSIVLAVIGMGYYATTFTLGRRIEIAAASVAVLAVLVPTLAYLGWRRRYEIETRVIELFTPFVRRMFRVIPRLSPPDPEDIRQRVEGFFRTIERVATNRRGLAVSLGFSGLGWLLLATSLWTSLFALGQQVPVGAVLFIVPVAAIAGVTPFPGGLGGVETVLVLLLVSTTGVGAATASAAVLIHRGATYWLPILVGGGSTALLEARNVRE